MGITGAHLELEGGSGAGARVLPGQLHGVGDLVLRIRGPTAQEGDTGGVTQPSPLRVGIKHVLQHWWERDGAVLGSSTLNPWTSIPCPCVRSPRGGL